MTPFQSEALEFVNAGVCLAIASISLCRLTATNGQILLSLRTRYALLVGGSAASAFQPWLWGTSPTGAGLALAVSVLMFLFSSAPLWRYGPPEFARKPGWSYFDARGTADQFASAEKWRERRDMLAELLRPMWLR